MAIYTDQEQDGNLIDTIKKGLISEIKEIINNYGEFSTGEVQAESDPCVPNQKGNLWHLINYFGKERVDVEVYGSSEQVLDEYSLDYFELEVETLKEILELCQAWQEINTEE